MNRFTHFFRIFVLFFTLFLLSQNVSALENDYIYFKNFVKHADGTTCQHLPPGAAFTAYLNEDESKVLLENAPRWDQAAPANIPGDGTFGVELGNFADPALSAGDSVFVRFTCTVTGQQATVSKVVTAIPWAYFPAFLTLNPLNLPPAPQSLHLSSDSTTFYRTLTWASQPGMTFDIYRRSYSDTIADGRARMLYSRIAQNISGNSFTDNSTVSIEKYGYIIYALSSAGIRSPHSAEVNEDPYVKPGLDLTISYISRLPRMDYVWGGNNPAVQGWPFTGSDVIWHAVVKNWSDSLLTGVPYKWSIDGVAADSGTLSIPPLDTAAAELIWPWSFNRHEIRFFLDAGNQVPEEEEGNNSLLVYSDAISCGFYVEQSVYDYFHEYQKELGVHSNCWEDWAHRHINRWNSMFANAIFPDAPQGVRDRIRLDKITVVPDSALPLAGGSYPTNMPNLNDLSVDLQWGFPATLLDGSFYANHTSTLSSNAFYFEGSLMHELGHARYLIDLYGFNVNENGSGETVAIMENGQLVAGTSYMPLTGGGVYNEPMQGLMNGQYTYMDEYSTMAMNLIAGHRAWKGNYNSPQNIGVFLQDLPQNNRLTVKDAAGNPLPGAVVNVFQAGPKAGEWYGKYYDNTPDLFLIADSGGQVLLGRCPFSPTGIITHTYGHSNGVVILRVAHEGKVGYGFLEVTAFNMEYWRGNTQMGSYGLKINLQQPSGMEDPLAQTVIREFQLMQNYPNPFNPNTTITFKMPAAGRVAVKIYNSLGQEVAVPFAGYKSAGQHRVVWDGKNNLGQQVSSGIYFYRFLLNEKVLFTKKMLMVR
ncbi:MAG: FlgD immunoglobulin-like domain containing protein [Calditrichia bacterium]